MPAISIQKVKTLFVKISPIFYTKCKKRLIAKCQPNFIINASNILHKMPAIIKQKTAIFSTKCEPYFIQNVKQISPKMPAIYNIKCQPYYIRNVKHIS